MTKAERLFWDAKVIAKDEKLWDNYVVGTFEGLKSFTQAIQKAERQIKFDSMIRNADNATLERLNVNKRALNILVRSREAKAKEIKCEKEIERRIEKSVNERTDIFDYKDCVRLADEIRKEVEAEFYGK